jgi:hypothetical protein
MAVSSGRRMNVLIFQIAALGEQTITIPACIESGQYLLRAELIALHGGKYELPTLNLSILLIFHQHLRQEALNSTYVDRLEL